jgi:hypothetical protein
MGTGIYTDMTFELVVSDLQQKYLHDMYLLSNNSETFKQKCEKKFRGMFDWFSTYVNGKK